MRSKIIVLAAALFLFTYFAPKTIYADNVWFSADCGHPGGQDQDCICVTKNCPNGDTPNGCFPEMGSNPSAEKMQSVENMVTCSNSQPTSAPNNPAEKPSCADPGDSAGGSIDNLNCAMQWLGYRQYLAKQQGSPTPTVTPTPTAYIPLHTLTPTPTPTATPTPTIKQLPAHTQKQTNHNNFASSLLQNVGKFFGTITKFLKNLVGRR